MTVFLAGIEAARKYYDTSASAPPLVERFHHAMMDIEMARSEPDLNRVRRSLENAVTHFGQDDHGNDLIKKKQFNQNTVYTTCKTLYFK